MATPRLERDGAELLAGAALPILAELEAALASVAFDRAGVRLHGLPALPVLLDRLGIDAIDGAKPVRAILFDKTAETNWALGWHQDRTIAVRARAEVTSFGPWTIKQGLLHVAPPFNLIERMRTIRIHLDAVPADNAPLRVIPGSHRLGMLPADRVDQMVAESPAIECLAERGDVWLYATPILHASAAAKRPQRRRVLQVDYSRDTLPEPLEWLGL